MNAAPWHTGSKIFEAQPLAPSVSPWPVSTASNKPNFADDVEKKKLFGVELAKNNNPFEAACCIFDDAKAALWVSQHWSTDPIALAARDVYLQTIELEVKPLDKQQLAAKVLKFAEEKNIENTRYLVDAKDRLGYLRLYSDIMGYTGKVDIDASTKTFTHNEMTVKLVAAEKKPEPKVVNAIPNDVKSEILNDETLPISIKLVGSSR